VAPDSLISIYGDDLADSEASAATLPLPTTLGGATVTANGAPLGLLFAGPGQINAFVPSTVSGLVRIKVTNSKGHHTVNVLIAAAVPAAFALDGSGPGPAAALHALTGQLITGQKVTRCKRNSAIDRSLRSSVVRLPTIPVDIHPPHLRDGR
jgi:uncharacterized protein (TIGR03437 family)